MMADMDEEDRYGLFGLVIGLQNKDLPLVTENLLKVSLSAASTERRRVIIVSHHRDPLFSAWLSKRHNTVGRPGTSIEESPPGCNGWHR